jgi:glycosyltransferase domain-containing protein
MKYRGQIIVVDSSAIDLEDSELKHILQTPNVKWLKFDPDYFYVKKVTDVCSFVGTKYVTLLAEDDFYILSALEDCISFLESNSDYSCVRGRVISFKEVNGRILWVPLYREGTSVEDNKALNRFKNFFPDGYDTIPYYVVQRADIFKEVWELTEKSVSDIGMQEVMVCNLNIIRGKVKILPIFFAVREANTFKWCSYERFLEIYSSDKVDTACQSLTKELSSRDEISENIVSGVVRKQMQIYLERSDRKMKLNKKVGKIEPQKLRNRWLRLLRDPIPILSSRWDRLRWLINTYPNTNYVAPQLNMLKTTILSSKTDVGELEKSRTYY